MGVRNEWNTYTLGRYSEQPDETKFRATVIQAEKDRVVTQVEKDRVVTQAEKDRTISNDVSVVQLEKDRVVTQAEKDRTISNEVSVIQTDYSKLKGTTKITDGIVLAKLTPEGYQDVKTHTPQFCFTKDYADAQTDFTIITPTAGKKIQIVSTYASVGTNATNVTVAFVTSGDIAFKLYTEKKSSTVGNNICKTGAVGEAIKLTCPASTFISIGYDEVD